MFSNQMQHLIFGSIQIARPVRENNCSREQLLPDHKTQKVGLARETINVFPACVYLSRGEFGMQIGSHGRPNVCPLTFAPPVVQCC